MALALYDLADSYKALVELLETDGVDSDSIIMALGEVKGAIEEKAGNIATIVRMMDYDAEIIKTEEKRLKARREVIENKRDNIKKYLQLQMEIAGIPKIKTPTTTVTVQSNPAALQITDESKIPPKYLTIVPAQHLPNKDEIKKALKAGEEVPGAMLTQGKSLRIK